MSLRTKILLFLFAFQTLVFAFLTVIFALQEAARAQNDTRRDTQLLQSLLTDWVNLLPRDASNDPNWGMLGTRIADSDLVTDWVVVARREGSLHPLTWGTFNARRALAEEAERFEVVIQNNQVSARGMSVVVPFRGPTQETFAARVELRSAAARAYGPALGGLILAMTLGTVFLLLITYVYVNRVVLRPLTALIEGSARVAEGDFTVKIPEAVAHDEMATLVRTFNSMMARMEQYQRELQEEIRKAQQKITQTERSLFHAQRLTTTGTLAAGIAHEINNPLGGMMNAARRLGEGGLDAERQKQYVELIRDGLERIRVIVQQVLQFRPKPFEPEAVAVRDVIAKSIAFLDHRAKGKSVEVRNEITGDLPPVNGDPIELQQAFLNVLMNAVDACKPGEGMVTVYGKAESGAVRVSVADNGSGMDERTLARCMDPFFTTKDVGEGTGLGLSVANNILENHGGRLSIESSPGRGTTVTFILPMANELHASASKT